MITEWNRSFDMSIAKMIGEPMNEQTPHYNTDTIACLAAIVRWSEVKHGRHFKIHHSGKSHRSDTDRTYIDLDVCGYELHVSALSFIEAISMALYLASLKPKQARRLHGVESWRRSHREDEEDSVEPKQTFRVDPNGMKWADWIDSL